MKQVYIDYEDIVSQETLEVISEALDDTFGLQVEGGYAELLQGESEDEYLNRVRQVIDKAVGQHIPVHVELVSEAHLRAWEDGETTNSVNNLFYGVVIPNLVFTGVEMDDIMEVMR